MTEREISLIGDWKWQTATALYVQAFDVSVKDVVLKLYSFILFPFPFFQTLLSVDSIYFSPMHTLRSEAWPSLIHSLVNLFIHFFIHLSIFLSYLPAHGTMICPQWLLGWMRKSRSRSTRLLLAELPNCVGCFMYLTPCASLFDF